jgi:hypothetical protein
MHDDIQKLWMLLQIHRELVGHPKLKKLRMDVDAELAKFNMTDEPEVEPADAPPVYPANSGPLETDTAADLAPSDRRV